MSGDAGSLTADVRWRTTSAVQPTPLDTMLDQLRDEVAELRASRERLVLAADAEHRGIERELHEGLQQHLVALAVNLQLAGQLVDTDPAAAKALLREMRRHVEQALNETAELAQRIHPSLLDTGLAVALRSAIAGLGFPVTVDVDTSASYPPVIARTVFLCCLQPLERAGTEARATVTVREEDGDVVVDVVVNAEGTPDLDRLRDRVESLGGRLTILSEPGGTTRLTCALPLLR
jgi:signal transduction histidine kinase